MSGYLDGLNNPDPCPGLPRLEIGSWSLEKHQLLRRYVIASWAARSKWPQRVLIDLYCGPGRVLVRSEDIETDGGAVVGWRASRETRSSFTRVVIGDINGDYAAACAARLEALGASVESLVGPAEQTVRRLRKLVGVRGLHLAYLDPFNLGHLSFEILRSLAEYPHIDILVHFSVMDLQREIELDFDRDQSRLEAFAPGWRDAVDVPTVSKLQARARYVDYWLGLVSKLGFTCSRERPLMTNSNNGPLYRMMFLLRHPLAEKIWDDIARGPQDDLFSNS